MAQDPFLLKLYNRAEAVTSWLLQIRFVDKIKDEKLIESRSIMVSKEIENTTVESKKGWVETTGISASNVTAKKDINVFKVNNAVLFSGMGAIPYSYGGDVVDSTLKAKNICVDHIVKNSELTASKKIEIGTCSNSTLRAPVVEIQDGGFVCDSCIKTDKLRITSGIASSTIVLRQENGERVAYSTINMIDGDDFQKQLFPVVLPAREH